MIDTLSVFFLNGYAYVKKHPQLLFTLVLIIVIPVGFLVSGQQFLSAAKENQERLEKDRVGLLHDVFKSVIEISHFDEERIQDELVRIATHNPDINRFQVVRDDGNQVHIVASLHPTEVGEIVTDAQAYRISNTNPDEAIIMSRSEYGARFWLSFSLVRSETNVTYYTFVETSLEHIDSLFASRIITAYYWLFGILAIVLLLVLRHVRLIDYAYLYNETKKANEMKDLFTNMIAHELRAPLTAMKGYASMLRESKEIPTTSQNHALRIEESSDRLILIVNDLLDVARIHSGKLSVTIAPTNIQKILTSVIEAMQALAHEKGIQLMRDGATNDIFIASDEKRLYQAFTNLVSNSLKYTKAGSITIGIEERGDRVEIRVKDTGMGISAENQKNLFVPFFRVENTEMEGTVGTGLGMWITKQLIELMRGSIAVESIRGVGTHIVVTLPK